MNKGNLYHIDQGDLKGQIFQARKMSRCGSFMFVGTPNGEVRIHRKHVSLYTSKPSNAVKLEYAALCIALIAVVTALVGYF